MDRSVTADLVCLSAAAAVMAAGYCLDLAGLTLAPAVLLAVGILAAGAAAAAFRPRLDPWLAAVVTITFGYAMWLASPSFLPVTTGPDVVHHLQLIHFIARSGRLPHDAALAPYLLEMMNYTPGSHVLAAAAAAWCRADPLRIVYPMAALFVAIKTGTLYALSRRLIGAGQHSSTAAVSAPLLAFAPSAYFLGSLVQFFFFAQVVSEAFAMGFLAGLASWHESRDWRNLLAVAVCGVGVVLSWPIWIVPCGVAAAFVVLVAPIDWRQRAMAATGMLAPPLVFAAVHQLTHRAAASIVTASGAVTSPSIAVLGAGFVVVAAAGAIYALRESAARVVLVFLAATLMTSVALAALARFRSDYMAFKMLYLAVLPAAVLGSLALTRGAAAAAARLPRATALAAVAPVLIAILLVQGRIPLHRARGSLSLPARDVGLWARDHVAPACIDYFSRYWLTGYWLHLDVLGNPRASDRMRDETFDFPDVAGKWLEGRGLPYGIVEDMTAIPREIRADMDPLYQRGTFVLVRNRHPVACVH